MNLTLLNLNDQITNRCCFAECKSQDTSFLNNIFERLDKEGKYPTNDSACYNCRPTSICHSQ